MTLLFRYIFSRAFFLLLGLLLLLISAVWLTQSLRFIDVIVNHSVGLTDYFGLVVFLIPDLVALMIPICILIAGVHLFSRLKTTHELHALRALGWSNQRLAIPLIALSVICVITIYVINIFIMPSSFKHFRDQEHKIRNHFSASILREGTFNFLKGVTVFIKQRERDGLLKGVFIFKQPMASDKNITIMAEEGTFHKNDQQYALILKNGVRLDKEATGKMNLFKFDELIYDLTPFVQKQEKRSVKPYEKTLKELFVLASEDRPFHEVARLRTEIHQRLLTPWLALLDALIVCFFMLRLALSSRNHKKIIAGILFAGLATHIIVMAGLNSLSKHFLILPTLYLFVAFAIMGLFYTLNHPLKQNQ